MKALLAWCAPWLVALPITAVRRIVDGAAMAHDSEGAWLGEISGLAPTALPAWDLARLIGLPSRVVSDGTWIIIDRPLSAALRVDRCLQVADLTTVAVRALPPLAGGPPGVCCFTAGTLRTGLSHQPDFGLLLAPEQLLAAAAEAVAAGSQR